MASPSMKALTAGQSCKAIQQARVKKLINPKPTSCFSWKLALYLARKSMIGFIFTSLKVVNMAVSFLAATNLLATVLRKLLIFSTLLLRSPEGLLYLLDEEEPLPPLATMASSTSVLVILPFGPLPFTCAGLIPCSSINSLARGAICTSLSIETGAASLGASTFFSSLATGAAVTSFLASALGAAAPSGAFAVSSISTMTSPTFISSPSLASCLVRTPAFSAFTSKVAFSLSSSTKGSSSFT